MALNPNIILGIQAPDVVGSMARGNALAAQKGDLDYQNAFRSMVSQNGPGIMAGDQGALNAFARFDPQAALGVKATHEQMDQQRAAAKRAAAEYAMTLNREEAAREAQELETAVKRGIQYFQAGDLDGINRLFASIGEQPIRSLDEFPAVAAMHGDALSALKEVQAVTAPPKPADEYQRYVQEEQAAGRTPLGRIEFAQAKKGSEIIYGPDGQPIIQRGPAGMKPFTEAQSKDNVYAVRARGALDALEPVAGALTSRMENVIGGVPLGLGRELQSDEYQVAEQAGLEFLQAILRKDTGAAITKDETESYGRTYLPQPGDSPARLEAKRQARIRAVNALESGMSPAQMLARDRALVKAAEESGAEPPVTQESSESRIPDFAAMSDEELDAWIAEHGQ